MPRKLARKAKDEKPKPAAEAKPPRHAAKPAAAAPPAAPPEPADQRRRLAQIAHETIDSPPHSYPADGNAVDAIGWLYKQAGLPAPDLTAGRRIGEATLAAGDLVVFKSGKVCMVVERGGDPLLFTHRPRVGPAAARLSGSLQPPYPTTFLAFL